jgi:phage anti-repressor protein
MNPERLDIVQLIENNPITKLSKDYQTQLLTKIKDKFNDHEQQLFIASFYCYLQYDSKTDFIIDMDNVWKWLGFSRKDPCKRIIEKHFTKDIDYKILLHQIVEQVHGGHNKERLLMNIETFKSLCLLANTERSKTVRKYYYKLEQTLHELLEEESKNLKEQLEEQRQQLEDKEHELLYHQEQTELEKEELLEKTLLSQFPVNTQCIYYGKIDNTDTVGGNLIKFGMSNNLQDRVKIHKKTYKNFRLKNAFKVANQIEIENCIKRHPVLKRRIRNIMIDDMNYRELICIDKSKHDPDFTLEKLEDYIKEIIDQNQYNLENYKRLLEQNNNLQSELFKTTSENNTLKETLTKLQKQLDKFTPTQDEVRFKTHNRIETSGGYSLFAFECLDPVQKNKFKIGLCKQATLDTRKKVYKASFENGDMKLVVNIKHPFLEKTLMYILKRYLTFINNDTFIGCLSDVQLTFSIIKRLEDIITNNDLTNIKSIIHNERDQTNTEHTDPEVPFIKKSKRSIDQIEKDTGNIIATYPSIEAAGRALGLTTGTAVGIALRNTVNKKLLDFYE